MDTRRPAAGKAYRPALNPVPVCWVWPPRPGRCYATMSRGQWDSLLAGAYAAGFVLLELDDEERITKAYRRP
jgi:hypothetical protein